MRFIGEWFILCLATTTAVNVVASKTVYEALGEHRDLRKFHEMVNRDEVLSVLLQNWPVTVFAPTDDAIDKNNEWILGRESKVVSYHVLNFVAEKTSFPFTSVTSLSGSPPLYMGLREVPGGSMEYYVNNAKITRSEELVSLDKSKQLLYVIDELLVPYVSSTSLLPTAFQLLDQPEVYDIREPLGAFNSRVKAEGLEELFLKEGNHTFFLPVGAGIGHSLNRQLEVDKWVIRGHIIPRNVIFTRLAIFDSYPSDAYGGDIKVELSILNESNAVGDSYTLYAQSHTINSNYRHKRGIVLAEILRPNIPVTNGVVHLIESPLMIVDITVWKFLLNEKDGQLSEFYGLINYAPDFKDLLQSTQEKTLFAPSNDAIRQLDPEVVSMIKKNITAITNLLKLHLVTKSISTDDVMYGRQKEYISADNRNSLYFRILEDGRNKTLTVEGVGVKAVAVHSDIVAVNGMVHVIDKLLGMPYQTVYEKLQMDTDLKISAGLTTQDIWGKVLNGNDHRFTFFVPSDEAWLQLQSEFPTEFKQLTMGAFPYDVHKILDQHLVVNRELRSVELERITDIQMVHGRFKIIHGETPARKTIVSGGLPPLAALSIEWEGLQARIIRPDVQAVNGVMHVIDRVMMKRRDLTKSASSAIRLQIDKLLLFLRAFVSIVVFF